MLLNNRVGEKLTIVAIGSDASVESLKILGVKILLVKDIKDKDELAKMYNTILNSRAVIIEEELYKVVSSDLENILSTMSRPPLLIVVPNFKKPETDRLKELHKRISLAIGVKLKWSK